MRRPPPCHLASGEDLAHIGAELDLTRERVRQIVRATGARMPREYKCAVLDCYKSPRAPERYCFAHLRRLDRYGDPLEPGRQRYRSVHKREV